MGKYSFIFDPQPTGGGESASAPSPEEIQEVLKTWRKGEEAGRGPAATPNFSDETVTAKHSAPESFTTVTLVCPGCLEIIKVSSFADMTSCPYCKTSLGAAHAEQASPGQKRERGAVFESLTFPTFHLSVDELLGTLDLPRWFTHMGAHRRDSRRIPINRANVGFLIALAVLAPVTIGLLISGLVMAPPLKFFLMSWGQAGAVTCALLLWLRPYVQSYLAIEREKIMLVSGGNRQVLHFQRVDEIRNDRRLSGWGYAYLLGTQHGRWMELLYGWVLQWFDPRAWTSSYPRKWIQYLPATAGGARSRYFTNVVVLKGELRRLRIPFNGSARRDLTQSLAVVVLQVRSMNAKARIDVAALQVAQREAVTAEQWKLGLRS